jgi:DNA-binding response OmpR family regulator
MPNATILIADADRRSRGELKKMLEAPGYRVVAAHDGEEALAICKQEHPAIALIDAAMPGMEATDLIAYIRALSHRTTVVVLAGAGTVQQAVAAMKLGAADYIEKPVSAKAVQLLCWEIFQRQRLGAGGTVEDFLNLAEIAKTRGARIERRLYLKSAMLRDLTRPEPYYYLGELYESAGDLNQAARYYYSALDARNTFEAARLALKRLGYLGGASTRDRSTDARAEAVAR